ncbi:MAG: SDR family oxidoreductase [Deltaproteobacteria bacterium]|nr:SDR family oxidoreductase [Deltaproteobacteria bacterium]
MDKRLEGKVAIVTGAGQTPGETIGNGRAISLLFARAGARVLAVDLHLESARETQSLIEQEGGESLAVAANVCLTGDCQRMAELCIETYGCIDILVNNVGIGRGDQGAVKLKEEDWDNILNVNLKSMFLTCKHVLPYMEKQESGSVINISSAAAVCTFPLLAYKTSKAGVNALTHSIAMRVAKKGIRVNAIMPGLLNTPMAVEGFSEARGISKEDLIRERDNRVPLKGGMGTAWDTAYAALFLASDEARFITSVILPVDGGQCGRIG